MLNFKQLGLAAAITFGFAVSATAATTESTDFKVKITITESCTIKGIAATDVDFGSVVRSVAAADAQGSLVVNCSSGAAYSIGLNNGVNASGSQRNMKLSTGSNLIGYNLFSNAGRTTVWGDLATAPVSGTGTGVDVTLPIFGRVTGSTDVPAGDYVDTVTATVSY